MVRELSLALSAVLIAQTAVAAPDIFCADRNNVISYEDTRADEHGTWVRIVHLPDHDGWGWITGVACPMGDRANSTRYEPHPAISIPRLEKYVVEKVRTGTVSTATASRLIGLRGSRQYVGNDPQTGKPYGVSCCELGKE
ncbi:MAG: hypothetical protein AAFY31_04370 [Pseudomonadota bacterium]